MIIGVDATALYGPFGGIEGALWNTLQRLPSVARDRARFVVWVPADAPDFVQNAPHLEIRSLPFAGGQKLRRIAWQQLELPRWTQTFDLLWSPTYVCPLAAKSKVLLGVPDLIALDRPQFATRANRAHYRTIMPRALERADKILVTSPIVAQRVRRRVPDTQIFVAPLGVEDEFRRPIAPAAIEKLRHKYELPREFLLFVGNFEPKKNLPNLLRAVQKLDLPLVVAGGARAWPDDEKQLRGVRKLGFVPRDELPILMASCAVFCFPSRAEGFGMPVLEALAVGARVVASSEVPLPGLSKVAHTPPPLFPRAIANAIEAALGEPQPNEAGCAYALPFTWNRTAQLTWNALRKTAGDFSPHVR